MIMNLMKNSWICLLLLVPFYSYAQHVQPNMPWIDISGDKSRQVIIAQGALNLYNGHPTMVMLDDNQTAFCTWTLDHGGKVSFWAISKDGAQSWKQQKAPVGWDSMFNCPSIYKLTDKAGKDRLMIFSGEPKMGLSYSEDEGKTWTIAISLNKPCVMAFSSIIKLKNGDYLGLYHRGNNDRDEKPLTLWQSISKDGGLTWGESVLVGKVEGRSPCEPCVLRSPNGEQLVCIARENNRVANSLMMFSDNEGKSWTPLRETPWGLTGDRHVIKYAKDGRLVAAFRDMAPDSPTKGHFVAWVGNYKDLLEGTSGQYRVKLMHSYAGSDCGYPGLEILPDGTIVAITYIKIRPGEEQHSIVQTRFKLAEIDAKL